MRILKFFEDLKYNLVHVISRVALCMDLKQKQYKYLTRCFHCGDRCSSTKISFQEKYFCCEGCKMVFSILNENNLCEYYTIDDHPGINRKIKVRDSKFAFLDNETIKSKLLSFSDGVQSKVVFYLPQMHCNSCIWLLENLNKIEAGILYSQVNFLKKEIIVTYSEKKISLRKIAELLTSVGYEPHISMNDLSKSKSNPVNRSRIYKIGVAGFAFGNIMMLSFPEYFSAGNIENSSLKFLFNYLNIFLSIPVFFYSASEFFISGFKGLKNGILNIDAPIALAILITFSRSVYEVLSQTGVGYFDSMTGIVFFMLVGRYFQDRTYETISFDRDYSSYFPIGVTSIDNNGVETQIPVSEIKEGTRIRIYAHEIVPADAILFFGKASIDYSFVTGESVPIEKSIGEIIYAGGKQTQGVIELEVVKEVSQSYLTQLWNNEVFKKDQKTAKISFIHRLSKYFTIVVFSIALVSFIFWQYNDSSKAWNALTAVLIVACPCALLLSATFTYGNMMRVLQKFNFFVRNSQVVENISSIDSIVFDKTGTITSQTAADITYVGKELTDHQSQILRSLAASSNHPLSKAIVSALPISKSVLIDYFKEIKGMGLEGEIDGVTIKIGSENYFSILPDLTETDGSRVYISFGNEVVGYYLIKNHYRKGLPTLINSFKKNFKLRLISGDNDFERLRLGQLFGSDSELLFNCKPEDKLLFIKNLQTRGEKVIMLGDGLNDAGALMQSDVGISVTDNINNFSPACDAILDGGSFPLLSNLISYCKKGKTIIAISFFISILYNLVGMFFAVKGDLKPVFAAILMPVSSISIVLITTGLSSYYGSKISKK